MAIEIVPKPVQKPSLSLNILFFLSLIVFLGTLFSYLVLIYLEKRIPSETQRVEAEIARARNPEEISLEKELNIKKKKIDDFSKLIAGRNFPTKFLEFSEDSLRPFSETKKFASLIHPQVQLSNFSLDLKNSKVSFSGLTENFVTLEQQLIIFQKEPLITGVNLSSFSSGEKGKISFSFELSFDPSVFK